jgi:hypothetical protein
LLNCIKISAPVRQRAHQSKPSRLVM